MFRRTLKAFGSQPQGVIGLALLLIWLILALGAGQLVPYDPLEQGLPPARADDSPVRQAPSSLYWFGTDELGRDVLSRVLAGAHISLALGFISVSIGLVAGTALGLIAGFYGGWVDGIVMRAMDALLAFPGILLALVVIAALVGADGLGVPVVRALTTVNIAQGFEAGLSIVIVAILLDRILKQVKGREADRTASH